MELASHLHLHWRSQLSVPQFCYDLGVSDRDQGAQVLSLLQQSCQQAGVLAGSTTTNNVGGITDTDRAQKSANLRCTDLLYSLGATGEVRGLLVSTLPEQASKLFSKLFSKLWVVVCHHMGSPAEVR